MYRPRGIQPHLAICVPVGQRRQRPLPIRRPIHLPILQRRRRPIPQRQRRPIHRRPLLPGQPQLPRRLRRRQPRRRLAHRLLGRGPTLTAMANPTCPSSGHPRATGITTVRHQALSEYTSVPRKIYRHLAITMVTAKRTYRCSARLQVTGTE